MDKKVAEKILSDTEKGYDFISNKFAETRKFFWRHLELIKDYAVKGNTVLDYGCGNGRLLDLLETEGIEYFGIDPSVRLVQIAKSRHDAPNIHFQKIDPIQDSIPFNDDFFNATYSIAVFHHFPSVEYRKHCAKELYRVTKKGGTVIITVWNLWQRKYITNIFKNWYNKIVRESNLDWHDCYIQFRDNQGNVFQRFHHAFEKNELKKLFSDAGFQVERCEVIDGRNILLVGRK